LVVEVRDTGSGMSAEVRRRIFEPFFTTKPFGVGTGLGLPVCQTIAHEHRGSIEVESAPGRGSTFRVTLPIESGPSAPVRERPGSSRGGGGDLPVRGSSVRSPDHPARSRN